MQFRDNSRKRAIINITSLIDVLFLLLIFFIVSSTFLEQPGMKLDLPQTSGQEAVRIEGYTLFILSDGSIYLNEEELDFSRLPERLQEIAPEVEERGLIFKADETTRYGLVVEIMDIVKQSGITKLIIASQPKKEE
ncbi:biopolymer transporter ExbD [bacterium]|nr:biopolymer transporter ExbD [bacterium]RQV94728.1 MAG: biopolymer transporter ExbD [bacterium]